MAAFFLSSVPRTLRLYTRWRILLFLFSSGLHRPGRRIAEWASQLVALFVICKVSTAAPQRKKKRLGAVAAMYNCKA